MSRYDYVYLMVVLSVGLVGCGKLQEIDNRRENERQEIDRDVASVSRSAVPIPVEIALNQEAAAAYSSIAKAKALLETFQTACRNGEDYNAFAHSTSVIPPELEKLAETAQDPKAAQAMRLFANAMREHLSDLQTTAMNSSATAGDPQNGAAGATVGILADTLLTVAVINSRYKAANQAAAEAESLLSSRYGVDFPIMRIGE